MLGLQFRPSILVESSIRIWRSLAIILKLEVQPCCYVQSVEMAKAEVRTLMKQYVSKVRHGKEQCGDGNE